MSRYALFLIYFSVSMTFISTASSSTFLDDLRWQARIIVVTGNLDNAFSQYKMSLFYDASEAIKERDIVFMHFYEDQIKLIKELSAFSVDVSRDTKSIKEKLDINTNIFSLTLIGKDGGIKKVWTLDDYPQLEPETIFKVIDSMPMRQKEMYDQND